MEKKEAVNTIFKLKEGIAGCLGNGMKFRSTHG